MPADVIVVALDAADETLIDRFGAEGALPNLRRLRERSHRAAIRTVAGLSDDALWASFQYAVPLGRHDRYFWRRLDARSGRIEHAWETEPPRESFWDAMSAAGRRVAVFDMPKCILSGATGTTMIANWIVHGRYGAKPSSSPAALAAQVVDRFGDSPPSICSTVVGRLSDHDTLEATEHLLASIGMKRDAALHYLGVRRWDVFMTAFKEAHCVSHMLWNLVDPAHPRYDSSRNLRLGEPVKRVFAAIDAALGEILGVAGADATTVVFSTTGFAPTATAAHLLTDVVDRIDRRLAARSSGVSAMLRRSELAVGAHCMSVPHNENCGAIRLKVRGRDRGGRIRESDYEDTLDRICDWLAELRDVATGDAVVGDITRLQQRCSGPAATNLPDLLLHWGLRESPRAIASVRLGTIEAEPPNYRPGDHCGNGWLLATQERPPDELAIEDVGALIARTAGSPHRGRGRKK